VVTCGPEYSYYYLKDLQKFLWSTLKQEPVFQLIGKPISEELLMARFGGLPLGSVFVSVDYSDATDGMRSWASRACANAISDCIGLSDFDREVFIKALVGHTMVYKFEKDGKKEVKIAKQTNGQLMGSPVSFPILCLINAAVCRHILERGMTDRWADDEGELLTLREAPLLVNGDDGLFVANKAYQFATWAEDALFLGLKPSPGKTYVSEHFVQMNSSTFTVESDVRPSLVTPGTTVSTLLFREIPYVNFGFLSPFDPKGGRERTYRDLPALARDLIRGHPGKLRDVLMGWFLKSHRGLLEQIPEGMSYWLPAHLGGLGLPITRKLSEDDFSDMQLNFAAFLLQHLKEPTTFPAEEKTVPVWVRSGERLASSLRQREKADLDDDPWKIDERTVPEDEQFLYWVQKGSASTENQVIVPASRGNWKRLFAQFAKFGPRGSNSRPPLATLLGDPSPRMVLPTDIDELFASIGQHPTDLYGRISSLVDSRPYVPCERALGKVVIQDGVIFELFGNRLSIRRNPFLLGREDPERHVGLRCLLAYERENVTSDTNVCLRTPALAQTD
jgi:hypothetical protein